MLNIKDIFKRFTITKTSSIGFLLCIITIVILIIYTLVRFYLLNSGLMITSPYQEIINIIPTIGLSLLALGLAVISIGLSLHSQDVATDSDNKMISVANSNFLHAVGKFEDARLDFQLGQYPRKYALWKAYTYTKEGRELMKFCKINKEYQRRFISLFGTLINIYPWNSSDKIWTEELSHFSSIYDFMMELKVDKTKKDEITLLFIKKMNKFLEKKKTEDNNQYIKRLREEINKRNEEGKFREPFKK